MAHQETTLHSVISRRQLLRFVGLSGGVAVLSACSAPSAPAPTVAPPTAAPAATAVPKAAAPAAPPPTAVPAAPAAKAAPAWQAEWDELVKAAEAEDNLSIVTRIGDVYRNAVM